MGEESDPLDRLWPAFDAPDPVVGAEDAAHWPAGALPRLLNLGLLKAAPCAAQVVCPGCSARHVEEVLTRTYPDGAVRYFVPCPEALRAEVPPDLLLQWRPDFGLLARRAKELLARGGRVRDVVPGRLWRLGAAEWKNRPREVYLARGLSWPDGGDVARRAAPEARPIVLVGLHPPPASVWPGPPPAVVPLAVVMGTEGGELQLDRALLARLVGGSDETAALQGASDQADLERRVDSAARRRLAEGNTDDLVAALARTGMSGRAIEKELSDRGVRMHHATVSRKIKGVVKGRVARSSGSILRSGASQPRDRKGRPIADAQPEQEA